jgi:hypothetical protein
VTIVVPLFIVAVVLISWRLRPAGRALPNAMR